MRFGVGDGGVGGRFRGGLGLGIGWAARREEGEGEAEGERMGWNPYEDLRDVCMRGWIDGGIGNRKFWV